MIATVVLLLALTAPDGTIRVTAHAMTAAECKSKALEFLTPWQSPAGGFVDVERPRWAVCIPLPALGADA